MSITSDYTRSRLLTRVSAPADEPISLAEAKLYLRVDHDYEDLLINDLIVTARLTAEEWLKRSLVTQSWKLAYDACLPENVALPMGPVNSITTVTVINRDNTTQEIDGNTYYLNAARDALVFDSSVIGFRIEIVYSAGFGAASSVPRPIKQGMLAHIAGMYDNRADPEYAILPAQAISLYMPFRGVVL